MKHLLTSLLVILFLSSCQNKCEERYTQQSPEIDIVKKSIADYNAKQYDMSIYADTSMTYFNTKNNPLGLDQVVAFHQANDAIFSSRKFLDEDQEYEMVVTDDGETWVNAWLDWQGTLKESGKVIDIPIHLTYRFVDGKIVKTVGMWDGSEIALALMAQENTIEAVEE
jgi:hypothetical protein